MKLALPKLLWVFGSLILGCACASGETTAQLVKSAVERLSADNNFYGIVLVHDCQGNDLYKAEGNVDVFGEPFTYSAGRDQFLIASVSKQFAAAALLIALWESHHDEVVYEKRLSAVKSDLQKPVKEFLKKEPHLYVKSLPNWTRRVTLSQLLSHTSGLDEVYDWSDDDHARRFYNFPEVIDTILSERLGLRFRPGHDFFYSGSNYGLIAAIVENVTQKSFDVYLKEKIFDPLKMSNTFVMTSGSMQSVKNKHPNLMLPMKVVNGVVTLCDVQSPEQIVIGGSGIVATVEDLKTWQVGLHCKKTVLNSGLYELMTHDYTPMRSGYGYGIMMNQSPMCGKCLLHYGMTNGFRSVAMYFLRDREGIIILSNLETCTIDKKPYGYEALQNAVERALQLEE